MGSKGIIITISDDDKQWLENYSIIHEISMAKAIRKGIFLLKEEECGNIYQKIVKESKGIWKKEDGLSYQEKLRSESR